jgi:hypothetical protein
VQSRRRLDNPPAPRHDLGAVTRALRFLALFTALFVVTVRCLSGFPWADACAALPDPGAIGVCPASDEPREHDALAPVAVDDTDDASDAVIGSSPLRVRLLAYGDPSGTQCGILAGQRALTSHAPSLERPPRA